MYKWLYVNINTAIKYSRIYFLVSFIIFLVLGGNEFGGMPERAALSLSVGLGYLMFYNFMKVYLKIQIRIHRRRWYKFKKIARFQANFFLVFGVLALILIFIVALLNIRMLLFLIFAANVLIGLILGTIKSKKLYL